MAHRRNHRHGRHRYKKRLRSKFTVAKIAQAVVDRNLETKYQDQYQVGYPKIRLNHNVWTQIFDNLTYTKQGVENKPGQKLSTNRLGSQISPHKIWIKGFIELSALNSGFPVTKILYRLIIIRRPCNTDPLTALPTLPPGTPHVIPTDENLTSAFFAPNNFLANFDNRVNTVVYDKFGSMNCTALTQSQVAPDYPARGNSVSKLFNINLNMKKLMPRVEYSFINSTAPAAGIGVPKKHCLQMFVNVWASSDYDPSYAFTVPVAAIISQTRMYFKDG